MSDTPDEPAISRDRLDEWPEHRAASGFADRVVERLGPPPRGDRSRRAAAVGFAAGAALAVFAAWWLRPAPDRPGAPTLAPDTPVATPGPSAGELLASERTHARLGDATIAVVEPGARVRWETRGGRLDVEQARGRVFYRADRPFVVRTPAGALEVTGTSFSVDSAPARTELVVYEGAVLVASGGRRVEVAAGRRVRITSRGVGAELPAPWLDDAPAARGVAARATPAAACDRSATDSVLDPPATTLAAWADECRLRFDVAPSGYDPAALEHYLDQLGVTAAERPVVRDIIRAVEDRANRDLARRYVDVTGDDTPPAHLSVEWMFDEVMRSADPDEHAEVRRTLARERAGLQDAPDDLGHVSPYEGEVRWLMRSGDVLERELAAALGERRSRELRARHGGWPGLRWDVAGCPRD